MDFGAKKNIAKSLNDRGCEVTVYPAYTKAEEILASNPDGIRLSNGPGDPKELSLIHISDDDGKLIWECPNCGNRNQDKMNVARRTCGYIGTQFWNQGRTQRCV